MLLPSPSQLCLSLKFHCRCLILKGNKPQTNPGVSALLPGQIPCQCLGCAIVPQLHLGGFIWTGAFSADKSGPVTNQDVFIKHQLELGLSSITRPSIPPWGKSWAQPSAQNQTVTSNCHPALSPGEIQPGLSTGTTGGGFESSRSSFWVLGGEQGVPRLEGQQGGDREVTWGHPRAGDTPVPPPALPTWLINTD